MAIQKWNNNWAFKNKTLTRLLENEKNIGNIVLKIAGIKFEFVKPKEWLGSINKVIHL